MPYSQVPVLQLGDGRQLSESYAILRFLARRFGRNLAGRDEWEQVLDSAARLYTRGVSIDWAAFDAP